MDMLEIETPRGTAAVALERGARGGLILGHGAGGGIDAPDLRAAAAAAGRLGLSVARVQQPYRVLGRRSPPPIAHLDESWQAVIRTLSAGPLRGQPLIFGGRSMGARVACRTARTGGAHAVLCLAFPLLPPRRAPGRAPVSRLDELEAAAVSTLVVQGDRDPFGVPPAGPGRTVITVDGDHSLRSATTAIEAAVLSWIAELTTAWT